MVIFTSPHAETKVPENVTIWEWLFESERYKSLEAERLLKSFIDAETKERLNFADVKVKSAALSTSWVRNCGLCPGDTVTIISPNSIWYPVCALATFRAGAKFNGIPTAFTLDEVIYALKTAQTRFVICVAAVLPRIQQAIGVVGIPAENIFIIDSQIRGLSSIQDLIEHADSSDLEAPYKLPAGRSNKQLCGNLNFSSGTTGLPKAVMSSHHNVIAQCIFGAQIQTNIKSKLGMLPMYHVIGTWQFILFPIFLNIDIPIISAFSMRRMLQAIVEFRIDEVNLVPPIVLKLARDPIVDEYDLRHLKLFISGAAPLSSEILHELEQRFPWTGFRCGYGATEAGIVTANPETHFQYKYATAVGKLLPNTIAKVIDASGHELGPGQTGELLFKGPQVAMGYLDNEKANKEAFDSDGWYHSGDAGHFDDGGWLYIKDRIKEMIKVKGNQVAPAELEDLLHGNPLVADCAVIGIPDEYAGELPKAYIVLADRDVSREEAAQAVFTYVQQKKSRFKWLNEIEFVDVIPKSPAGKILRKELRAVHRAAALITTQAGGLGESDARFKCDKQLDLQTKCNRNSAWYAGVAPW